MKDVLVKWLMLTAAIVITSYLLPGIRLSGFVSALFAAAILGMLNAFFRPILLVLTLPINVLTLGLFTFVINALLLKMASGVIPGFYVHGFWTAGFGSLIISVINFLLSSLLSESTKEPNGRNDVIDLERRDGDRWE
jgi:putative membrane protein